MRINSESVPRKRLGLGFRAANSENEEEKKCELEKTSTALWKERIWGGKTSPIGYMCRHRKPKFDQSSAFGAGEIKYRVHYWRQSSVVHKTSRAGNELTQVSTILKLDEKTESFLAFHFARLKSASAHLWRRRCHRAMKSPVRLLMILTALTFHLSLGVWAGSWQKSSRAERKESFRPTWRLHASFYWRMA